MVAANSELLLRTKGTIIELKRENQRLIEKARLFAKLTQTPQETHIRKTLRQDIPCFISRIDSDRDKTDR